MSQEVSRRAVLAGLCGALALAFAPLDRFMAGLGAMLDRIFSARVPAQFLTYDRLEITFGGQTYAWDASADFVDRLRVRMYEAVGLSA